MGDTMCKPLSWKNALCLFFVAGLTTTKKSSAFSLLLGGHLPPRRSPASSSVTCRGLPPSQCDHPRTDRREVLKQMVTTVAMHWSLLLLPVGRPLVSSAMTTTTTATTTNIDDTVTSHPPPPPPPAVEVVVVRGRVTLPADLGTWNDIMTLPTTTPTPTTAALYLTCRPNRPDNVPMAILNGSRGKPPPVLSARIPLSSVPSTSTSTSSILSLFPLDFELTIPRDLTPEGAWDGTTTPWPPLPGSVLPITTTLDELWWSKEEELIISARLDSDGVAATRSPEDLVGRAIVKDGTNQVVEIQLTGRGAFGKFATGRK